MKNFIIGTLLLGTSTYSFAQSLEVKDLRKLLEAKKESLEKVNAGMTKKIVTTFVQSSCGIMSTSTQSILKIVENKVIILSKEKFQPQNTPACRTAGYTTSTENNILYYEAKPSLENDLEDLEASERNIKAISKADDIITMNLDVKAEGSNAVEKVTIKYDLSKPSFKYMISSQSVNFKTVIEDMADIDLTKVDLTSVSFCDNNDGDTSECTEGNYSDILY